MHGSMDTRGQGGEAQDNLRLHLASRSPSHSAACEKCPPYPVDLHSRATSKTTAFSCCSGSKSLEHLLSNHLKALGQGWYRWHHDQVLKAASNSITTPIDTNRHQHQSWRDTPPYGWSPAHSHSLGAESRTGSAAETEKNT